MISMGKSAVNQSPETELNIQLHQLRSLPFLREAVSVSRHNIPLRSSDWMSIEQGALEDLRDFDEEVPKKALALGALAVEVDVDFSDEQDEVRPIGYAIAYQKGRSVVLRGLCVAEGMGRPGLVGALMRSVLVHFDGSLGVKGYQETGMLAIMAERGFDNLAANYPPAQRYEGDIPSELTVAELRTLIDSMYPELPEYHLVDMTRAHLDS